MPKKRNQDTNTSQTLRSAAARTESVQPAQPLSVAKQDQTNVAETSVPVFMEQATQEISTWPSELESSNFCQEVITSESVDYFDDIGFPETNVILVVENKKIHVNKAVLSQHSPVFNAMFSGGFKESTAKEIKLENKRAKDVVEFLRCFYPNMKYAVTGHNVLQVLPLAHEYQSPLVDDCEDFMISMCKPGTSLTVMSLLDYIIAAEKYALEKFLDTAVEFCSHIDFDLLNGKTFQRKAKPSNSVGPNTWIYGVQETKFISAKFFEIDLKTRHAISVRRLQVLEMDKRKMKNREGTEKEYDIQLS